MRKWMLVLSCLTVGFLSTSCLYVGGGTDLGAVARRAGMTNVTTGDGTYENYTATGYYTGLEFGIAVGIPGLFKIMELYPVQSNEALLGQIAQSAAADGANGMINVTPPSESYWGLPFGIIGLYIDRTAGTGIKTN